MSYADNALALVRELQSAMVGALEGVSRSLGDKAPLEEASWKRGGGANGGGNRYVCALTAAYARVAVNVSHVFYDDAARALKSATALSTIVHPASPLAPSIHAHISWTEMKSGQGGWRIMADLNPSNPNAADTADFIATLKQSAPAQFDKATSQGDRYFYIPVRDRTRGVAHFYLEDYSSGDRSADLIFARSFGLAVIERYRKILARHASSDADPDAEARAAQLAYHTLYLLQVLTLDRGTTSGLLVHDENDVGIMGSLPAIVSRGLLASWVELLPKPQDKLLTEIIAALPESDPTPVDDATRAELARVVRAHYVARPEALALQAETI